jgi:hypothetical protein
MDRSMDRSYGRVVVTSGHMIDAPDRSDPRFPASLEPVVASEIERVLDHWGVGAGDLLLNGGARGADILFAESALRRGCDVELVLASEPEQFEQTSVALPRTIWVPRFRYLLSRFPSRVSDPAAHEGAPNEFARANADLNRRAEALAPPARLHIALVWDEQPAGGPGGTGDFADAARRLHAELAIVNPLKLSDD